MKREVWFVRSGFCLGILYRRYGFRLSCRQPRGFDVRSGLAVRNAVVGGRKREGRQMDGGRTTRAKQEQRL